MPQNLHILTASGRLHGFETSIREAFSETIQKVSGRISLPDVDVVVVDNPDAAIPETGVGGFAPTAHLLYVHIDPCSKDLRNRLSTELKSTLTHELHHCARWAAIGYGETLLEACISEGLADHFDFEVNGGQPKPWSVAVQGTALDSLIEEARPHFEDTYDEGVWFWGKGRVPRWAAYAIGFFLVGAYKERTGKSAAELVADEARSLLLC